MQLSEPYEARSLTKWSTRRFVMAFNRFRTPILLVESLLSELDSSNYRFHSLILDVDSSLRELVSSSCQFYSSSGRFDSSFYEFDSSLTTSVRPTPQHRTLLESIASSFSLK